MKNKQYVYFNPPPRIHRPLPKGKVTIPTPPKPRFVGTPLGWLALIAPIAISVLTAVVMSLTVILRPNANGLLLLSGGIMAIGMMVTGVVNILERLGDDREERRKYSALLSRREEELLTYNHEQQTTLHYVHPALPTLLDWSATRNRRLWERRINDEDFLSLRMGLGTRPSSVEVQPVTTDDELPMLDRARHLSSAFNEVADVPNTLDLLKVGLVGVVGRPDQTTPFLQALICHLAVHHPPDSVKVIATYAPQDSAIWQWLGWLPHNRIATTQGDEQLLVASQPDQIEHISNFILDTLKQRDITRHNDDKNSTVSLGNNTKEHLPYTLPRLIWVVDDFVMVHNDPALRKVFEIGVGLGMSFITAVPTLTAVPRQCQAIAQFLPDGSVRYAVSGAGGQSVQITPDLATPAFCTAFADALAPLRLEKPSTRGNLGSSLRLLDIMGVRTDTPERFDPATLWGTKRVGQLRVPIGLVFGGQPLFLDISDKGHGPHGLIAGTTGSGKSELLLTIVCALALANHPDSLNFVLGDFKGGATFNPFINLPHVVGMMSDLDLTVVERAMVAILAELKRREHLLKDEGVTHIRDYQKKSPPAKVPLPYLMVIIDEFAEMKEQAPDFMDRVINIARTGRTLGVYMILATQRPAGVVTGQLNSNTKYRLCLRVETTEDSSDMLGRKDAALLPSNAPGRAFFKVGNDIFDEFQVARVAIPFAPNALAVAADQPSIMVLDQSWQAAPLVPRPKTALQVDGVAVPEYDYDTITTQCITAAQKTGVRSTHKPWLDPLHKAYYLPDLLEGRGFDPKSGQWPETPPFGVGCAPLALLDHVAEQRQYPLNLDLLTHGSYCISGLSVSGKTTVLRTMLMAMALTHTPDDVRFCILDMGNTLAPFARIPHTARYISMAEQDELADTVADLYAELQRRKTLFAKAGVLNITAYRQTGEEPVPLLFIAFDNFSSVRHNVPYEDEHLRAIVREGRPYGLHLAITMERATDYDHGRMMDQFFQIALRQSRDDIAFSVPKIMIGSWNSVPGRGFVQGAPSKPPLEIQIVLPLVGAPDTQIAAITEGVAQMVSAVEHDPHWNAALTAPDALLAAPDTPRELEMPAISPIAWERSDEVATEAVFVFQSDPDEEEGDAVVEDDEAETVVIHYTDDFDPIAEAEKMKALFAAMQTPIAEKKASSGTPFGAPKTRRT